MTTRSARRHAPRGSSLIELLVVIGVIAILVGLVLPAVQASREAARQVRCASHLRQLVTAVHGFESAYGGFPGATWVRKISARSWVSTSIYVPLLPYLEESAIYDALNLDVPFGDLSRFPPSNATAASRAIGVLLCPSDPNTRAAPFGCSSYRACVGLGEFRHASDGRPNSWEGNPAEWGAFNPTPVLVRPAEIRDGLANTLAFSEKKIGRGESFYDPSRDWIDVGVMATSSEYLEICSNLRSAQQARADGGRGWIINGGIYTWFFASAPPNSLIPDCGTPSLNGRGVFAARSYHPGGVHAAMADGAVRRFTSTIAADTWRALGTRSGGEPFTQE